MEKQNPPEEKRKINYQWHVSDRVHRGEKTEENRNAVIAPHGTAEPSVLVADMFQERFARVDRPTALYRAFAVAAPSPRALSFP